MKYKKVLYLFLVCIFMGSSFCGVALGVDEETYQNRIEIMDMAKATSRFSMDVPGNSFVKAETTLPLDVGETVKINASYTRASAKVDFGLIAPDGMFYYISVSNGSINKGITVSQKGNYTFAIRNNSGYTINVSGYVNY